MKQELVKFYNTQIVCVSDNDKIYVVVKTLCDGLGLDSDRAIKSISEDEILGSERAEQTVQIANDQPRKMICLPLEFVNGWLFQVKFTNTMSEDTKQSLIRYKRECYKALFMHFFGNMKKQLEANKVEIDLLKEINELTDKKLLINDEIKEKKKLLEKIREKRLNNEPTLF